MPRSGSALGPCDAHLARAGVSNGALSPFKRATVVSRRVLGSTESRSRTCGSRNRGTPPPACKLSARCHDHGPVLHNRHCGGNSSQLYVSPTRSQAAKTHLLDLRPISMLAFKGRRPSSQLSQPVYGRLTFPSTFPLYFLSSPTARPFARWTAHPSGQYSLSGGALMPLTPSWL